MIKMPLVNRELTEVHNWSKLHQKDIFHFLHQIQKLNNASLLEDGFAEKTFVKMHDLVRVTWSS